MRPDSPEAIEGRQRIGTRIKTFRERSGMSRARLAEAAGMSNPACIHKYETGRRTPGILIAIRLADALGMTLDDLFGRKHDLPAQTDEE
jgi:DNA-binding XRE family transcriptional regulator